MSGETYGEHKAKLEAEIDAWYEEFYRALGPLAFVAHAWFWMERLRRKLERRLCK